MDRFGVGSDSSGSCGIGPVTAGGGEVCRWQGSGPPSFLVHEVHSTFRRSVNTKYLCIIHNTAGVGKGKDGTDAREMRECEELESMAGSRSGSGSGSSGGCASCGRSFDRVFAVERV